MSEITGISVQAEKIAERLNISKYFVKPVLVSYIDFILDQIRSGNTVKFLNVCIIRINKNPRENCETRAYIANKLSTKEVSPVVVARILEEYEQCIVEDLKDGGIYRMQGLCTIGYNNNSLSCRKSTKISGHHIVISFVERFKRRVVA